mgnify:CR=1 FL=1
MVRRSRLEIYFEVLEVIARGIDKPTRVMYKTNLSWNTLQDIFETLRNGSFISEVENMGARRYYITEKGRNALNYHLKSLNGLIKVESVSS